MLNVLVLVILFALAHLVIKWHILRELPACHQHVHKPGSRAIQQTRDHEHQKGHTRRVAVIIQYHRQRDNGDDSVVDYNVPKTRLCSFSLDLDS